MFGQNLQKRSKIEKVNINIKFCTFMLVYSNFISYIEIEYIEAEVF